jgi:alpha-methylacyl-CoA racemase
MTTASASSAPLAGIKVVHLASLGPGPYAAMLLADLGCEVIIIDRTGPMDVSMPQSVDPRRRGQRSIALDLKQQAAREVAMRLIANADVLIEGMRPGAMERLGLGPDTCTATAPRLIYVRVTGWGQTGPLAQRAGHDINYIGLSGALLAMGPAELPPPPPLNLLGDYAGGGTFAVMGILAALVARGRTGTGQVIDAAIVDGVASLTAPTMGMLAQGSWGARGTNLFDGSAPWYRTYRTKDGRFVAVGALEAAFYEELLRVLGLDPAQWVRDDRSRWPALAERLAKIFASQDRDHWETLFEDTDACVSPVLGFDEAAVHPQHRQRSTYFRLDGVTQPAPAPRVQGAWIPTVPPPAKGRDTRNVLGELGMTDLQIEALLERGAAHQE